jgi:hypothetical protein
MKKLFTIILLMSFVYGYGQSIQLIYNDEVVNNNDTITVDVQGSGDHYLDLINTSTSNINMMIKREIISLLQGADNYFCFYDCLTSTVDRLPSPVSVNAGDTLSHKDGDNLYYFYTHYDPYNHKGISLIKFNFSDNDNPTDVTSVVFKFNSAALGITDNQTAAVALNAYPNPATTKIFVQHDLKKQAAEAKILVTNLMGVTLKTIPVNPTSNKTQIDISDFASGIYFYSLEVNGKISVTKKLIVK